MGPRSCGTELPAHPIANKGRQKGDGCMEKREQKAEGKGGGGGGQEVEGREGDSLKIPRSWRVSKYQQLFPEHKINTLETHALCGAELPAPRAALFPRQPRHLALLDGSSRGVPALLTARQHPASQTQHRRPLLQ